MSLSVLRTLDDGRASWWVLTADGTAARVATDASTTAELLADRAAVEAAAAGPGGTPVADLALVSPVSAPCRVVAQMTNYVSHVTESGMDPDTIPLTFFRKASGSISGPADDIVKPAHARFLDYEVELGLVIGSPLTVGDEVTEESWTDHVAGFVVTNDVSARDLQLPKTQFFEAKSYPTFTPTGPALVLLDREELERFRELRLRLSVNGQPRQDSTGADMIYAPWQALAALAGFQRLDPGDLVLTGTPGGTALKAPPRPIEIIGALLPPAVKWKAFFKSQAKNEKYLADGDVVEVSIETPDGKIDLGTQRTTVRYAR
ncbi:fumarylacetoacetate hydrolase family protein [Nocardioides sp. YIM 152588]|uniref:fumarylacetoacetate hydrolase family protein n=1 Tax=Nocardioides sp. YIM 152588 TaxID=3158259 RepID=UPI0032E4EB8B